MSRCEPESGLIVAMSNEAGVGLFPSEELVPHRMDLESEIEVLNRGGRRDDVLV